jgi:hypothetical protein
MRERLDTLAEMNPDQFSYDNILSEPDVAVRLSSLPALYPYVQAGIQAGVKYNI